MVAEMLVTRLRDFRAFYSWRRQVDALQFASTVRNPTNCLPVGFPFGSHFACQLL